MAIGIDEKIVRLDKFMSHLGMGSRKDVKKIIRKGVVSVDGIIVKDDDFKVNLETAEIVVNDTELNTDIAVYMMMNKPDGYLSATFDSRDKTVMELITGINVKGVFPVGRLDKDTEGLLILSNDGKLAHDLLSPKNHVQKKYYVKLRDKFSDDYLEIFEKGMQFVEYTTKSAILTKISDFECYITITEGKFHQVKNMFEFVNNEVVYLKRVEFGGLMLPSDLEIGQYRRLTADEIEILKRNNV